MKKEIKKTAAVLLAFMLMLGVTACNNNNPQNPDEGNPSQSEIQATNPSESQNPDEGDENQQADEDFQALSQLIENIIGEADDELTSAITEAVPQEAYANIVYTDYVEGAKAVVSQPMMSSIAHMVVLVQFPEGTDMQAVAEDMKQNMDPRRWVCVEPEKTAVEVNGNYALLVMSTENVVDTVVENFKNMEQ